MNRSLTEVPLLEVVALVFLMAWVDFAQEDHFIHKLSLLETLINEQIVFLVDGSVTALAGSDEYLESSSQSSRVVGVEGSLTGPMEMAVVTSHGVDLLFVTLDAVGSTNVVSVQPGLVLGSETAGENASSHCHDGPVNKVV
jgi:hypothetical protein